MNGKGSTGMSRKVIYALVLIVVAMLLLIFNSLGRGTTEVHLLFTRVVLFRSLAFLGFLVLGVLIGSLVMGIVTSPRLAFLPLILMPIELAAVRERHGDLPDRDAVERQGDGDPAGRHPSLREEDRQRLPEILPRGGGDRPDPAVADGPGDVRRRRAPYRENNSST